MQITNWVRHCKSAGVLVSCLFAGLIGTPVAGSATTITVGHMTAYLPSEIEANIVAAIAERHPELGVDEVKLLGTDVTPAWVGIQRGDIDVLFEVDLPNQQPLLDKASNEVETVSQIYGDAGQGFFVPRYVVDGEDAPAAGLKSIDQLQSYKDILGGTLYDEAPGWQSTKYNAMRLKAYGLEFEHVKLADAALVAEVTRAVERKKPILFFFAHPHWLFKRYDLVKLDEPDSYQPGCFVNDNGRCPIPSFSAWVGVRKDLVTRAPKFYAMLTYFEIPLGDVEAMMFEIDRDKQPIQKVAQAWVENHSSEIAEWVKLALGG